MSRGEDIVGIGDAARLGFELADLADRVKVAHACMPGTVGQWSFVLDGIRFAVAVRVDVEGQAPSTASGSTP